MADDEDDIQPGERVRWENPLANELIWIEGTLVSIERRSPDFALLRIKMDDGSEEICKRKRAGGIELVGLGRGACKQPGDKPSTLRRLDPLIDGLTGAQCLERWRENAVAVDHHRPPPHRLTDDQIAAAKARR